MGNRLITSAMLEQNHLTHYGVKGMKWGVRKSQDDPVRNNGLDAFLLAVGVTFALAATKSLIGNAGSDKIMTEANSDDKKIKSLKQVQRIQPPELMSQTVRNCNNTKSLNKNFKHNCPNVALAYELRRRGYDVQAKPAPIGLTQPEILKTYNLQKPDITLNKMGAFNGKETNRQLNSYFDSLPDQARGSVIIQWDKIKSGHIFNYEKNNGKITFLDAQSGKSGEFKGVNYLQKTGRDAIQQIPGVRLIHPSNYLEYSNKVEIFRTDNLKINEEDVPNMLIKR